MQQCPAIVAVALRCFPKPRPRAARARGRGYAQGNRERCLDRHAGGNNPADRAPARRWRSNADRCRQFIIRASNLCARGNASIRRLTRRGRVSCRPLFHVTACLVRRSRRKIAARVGAGNADDVSPAVDRGDRAGRAGVAGGLRSTAGGEDDPDNPGPRILRRVWRRPDVLPAIRRRADLRRRSPRPTIKRWGPQFLPRRSERVSAPPSVAAAGTAMPDAALKSAPPPAPSSAPRAGALQRACRRRRRRRRQFQRRVRHCRASRRHRRRRRDPLRAPW